MKNLKIALFILLPCGAAMGQQISGGTFNNDEFHVRYRTVIEPPGPDENLSIGSGVTTENGRYHRYVGDAKLKKYFGYDMSVEPAGAGIFRVSFKPLSVPPDPRVLKGDPASWSAISLPKYPDPQEVHDGDTIALDLLINPATGQRMVDYLTVTKSDKARIAQIGGNPRELQVEDIWMHMTGPRVSVNGKKLDLNQFDRGGVTGPALWFYLPERGRFVLSVARHEALGFRKAGEVRGDKITFSWGGDSFEIETRERIVQAGDSVFDLFVYHDARYRPRGESGAGLLYGAADKAEALIRR